MAINVIDKYALSKKKKIYSYCKSLSKIVSIRNKNIFESSTELNDIISFCADYYVDKLMLINNVDMYALSSYYKYSKDENISFNKAYCALAFYYNKNDILQNYSLKIFYLLIILSFSFNLDKTIEINDVNKTYYRNIINGFINVMNNEVFLLNKNYKDLVNTLSSEIINNKINEELFFKAIKTENAHNEYAFIDQNDTYLLINYKYNNDALVNYDKVDVNRFIKKNNVDLKNIFISYELSGIELFKLKLKNKGNYKLLLKINYDFASKESNLLKLKSIIKNDTLRSEIYLFMKYNDVKNDVKVINKMKEMGFNVLLDYENQEINNDIDTYIFTSHSDVQSDKIIIKKENDKEMVI